MNRLIYGDCIQVMEDLLANKNMVDTTLTDIPYEGVNRASNGLRVLDKGDADVGTFDLTTFLSLVYGLTNNNIIIFCGQGQISTIFNFFFNKKGTVRQLVWHKSNPSPMNGDYVYLSGIENAIWFKKKGSGVFNAHCKNTVFKYPNGKSKLHPTEKNHALLKELIIDNSNEGDTIFDPCMGSGSTGLVASMNNRNFMGIEISKEWFNVTRERLVNIGGVTTSAYMINNEGEV